MMKKRILSVLLIGVLAAALFAAGCGSDSSSDTDTTDSASSETASTDVELYDEDGNWTQAYAGTELTFLDVSPSDTRTGYFEELFERFEEDTGVSVEYQSVPWDDAADKVTVLGASDSLPDVLVTYDGWLGQLTESEWLVPLTDYIGDTTDEYTAAVTDILWKSEQTRYGDIYTVPDGLMVKGIYVRKDWCEELGIELDPEEGWTYQEYFDLVEALTDEEQGRYGVSFRGARGALDPLLVYMQGYTGGATYDSEGNILINSDECLEAFITWCDLYLDGYAPEDSINWGFTEMVDNFVGGLTGTLINDSEVAATLIESMEDDEWMVMPMPYSEVDGKIYNTMGAPYSYGITTDSENYEASWLLISYMTSAEEQSIYCQLTGEIPIKNEASDLDYYSEDGYYGVFMMQLNDEDLSVPPTYGAFDYTDLHQGLFHEEIQSYLLGDEDAETALNNICDALQERMDEYLEENPDAEMETALSMTD